MYVSPKKKFIYTNNLITEIRKLKGKGKEFDLTSSK